MGTGQKRQQPDEIKLAAVGGPDEQSPGGQPLTEQELIGLYEENGPRLMAFLAARMPKSAVEDAFQEVWVRALRSPPPNKDGALRAWLFQIARNYVIDSYRKKSTEPLADEIAVQDHRQLPADEILEDQERREILERCLQALMPRARAIVAGRLAGESYEELCPSLGITAPQAHKAFHAAKDELQNCVKRALP